MGKRHALCILHSARCRVDCSRPGPICLLWLLILSGDSQSQTDDTSLILWFISPAVHGILQELKRLGDSVHLRLLFI
ncbi:hypothetical protein F5Y12DRAFT_725285 [Xylaria sp. FL1777]|nr:hypothetical protein F5Y12DRAFT_725285 [Xylaria sp. FL1777]